ncbi:Protein NLRC5 [Durusdinium trenchii]|uniref:Protein NLRC5 n=1 Tax=Durusdinium trenchii TaxID=1381693 RepID=A0ABP0Q1G6_9DINO
MFRRGDSQVGERVRLFLFDFDQTLSVIHVFKSLAGWPRQDGGIVPIPKPYASSELGQVVRLDQLSREVFQEEGGFLHVAFGGPERIEQVRATLESLTSVGAELVICTKGFVGPVRLALDRLGWLQFFSQIYGHIGDTYGATPFDKQVAEERSCPADLQSMLGERWQAQWTSKDALAQNLMRQKGLSADQVILVEDDPQEIRKAKAVCRTLLVKEARGLTPGQLELLHRFSRGEAPPTGCSTGCWIL